MTFTMIVFFVLPWIIGIFHLHRRDKRIIPLIGPLASTIAFFINELWFYFHFGEVYPFSHPKTINFFPFNTGFYPIVSSYVIFFSRKSKYPYLVVFSGVVCITFTEYLFLLSGNLRYENGWNIFWTFVTYTFSFIAGYWFYLYLKKIKAIQ